MIWTMIAEMAIQEAEQTFPTEQVNLEEERDSTDQMPLLP